MKRKSILYKDLEVSRAKEIYDESCKNILANKIILAWIMKPSIPLRNVEFEEAWKFTKKETESLRISARCSSCKLRKVCNTCVAAAIAETGKADGVPEYLCRYTEATVRYLKETSKK